MESTSWQERYNATEIFTLRCRILDKPGMLGRFITEVGNIGAHIGTVNVVGLDSHHKIRDITVYCSNMKHLDEILAIARVNEYVEVESVRNDVLQIHNGGTIKMVSKVPIKNLTDLRMLYTPGVASVCEKIRTNNAFAWDMTGIRDRVAIVTNGTAVLGLGNIGSLASLPVMEGKASIFAEFADISAIPILINSENIDVCVETVTHIADSFGAIQLEDIAAPECFEIEQRLQEKLDKPVFHDDQHGTSTVVLAAIMNALKRTSRNAYDCDVLILGAGAAGTAIAKMLLKFGVRDVVVYDSTGPLYRGRNKKMNSHKFQLAEISNTKNQTCPLLEGFEGKDIFIGVASANLVSKDMVSRMAKNSIVFPLSNPAGEISIDDAMAAGAMVVANGREINNALAYPGLFRGALDVRAKDITFDMQVAAADKLAKLAGKESLLPNILDKQVHKEVAAAVSEAYMKQRK